MSSTVFDRLVELITQHGVPTKCHVTSRCTPARKPPGSGEHRWPAARKALICKGDNEVINFNAGDHSISVSMRYADYVQVEEPGLGIFAVESEP